MKPFSTLRDNIGLACVLCAPCALLAGIVHTWLHNSPGIILGFITAMLLGFAANIVAE